MDKADKNVENVCSSGFLSRSGIYSSGKGMENLQQIDENTSDGYHTFKELYDHRMMLFIALCNVLVISSEKGQYVDFVWKSKKHSDGNMYEGWFIAGLETNKGQITYHLPIDKWDILKSNELERAPNWDGHTSQDVISRLYGLFARQ